MKVIKMKLYISIALICYTISLHSQVYIYPNYFDNYNWSIQKHYYCTIHSDFIDTKQVKVVLYINNAHGLLHQSETSVFSLIPGNTIISEFNFSNYLPLNEIYDDPDFANSIIAKGYPIDDNYDYILSLEDVSELTVLASSPNSYTYLTNDYFNLIYPGDNDMDIPINTTFSWINYFQNNGSLSGTYKMNLVEISDGQTPEEALYNNLSLYYSDNLTNANYTNTALGLTLETCKHYAWQVTAQPQLSGAGNKPSEIWNFYTSCLDNIIDTSLYAPPYYPISETTNSTYYWVKDTLRLNMDYEYSLDVLPKAFLLSGTLDTIPLNLATTVNPKFEITNYFRPGNNDFVIPLNSLSLIPYNTYQLVIYDDKKNYYFNFIYY